MNFIYDITIFGHFHRDYIEALVYHAHPYTENSNSGDSSPIKDHKHSNHELLIISQFNASFVCLAFVISVIIGIFYKSTNRLSFSLQNTFRFLFHFALPPLRSPPIL